VDRRVVLVSGAEADQAAGGCEPLERRAEHRAPDALEHRIEARAAGVQLAHDLVRAELRELCRPASERGHVGTAVRGELDREAPDSSARAGDEHPAADQVADAVERLQRRQPGDGERRSLRSADGAGQLREPVGADGRELRPGAAPLEPDDPRPRGRAAAVGRGALHDAGDVPAPDGAGRRGGERLRLAAVERRRRYAHQRLERQRRWILDLVERDMRRLGGGDEREHRRSVQVASPTATTPLTAGSRPAATSSPAPTTSPARGALA